MRGDSAQLPVDFLVGFTIFILCLIAVANFVPSLLVGLQRTSGIDYDAVAYRTGVVLAEDPGWPAGSIAVGEVNPGDFQPWEQGSTQDMTRLGLSLYPDTPNIVSINKISKFFNTSLTDTDYRTKLLFSPYQYGYNITLRSMLPMVSGDFLDLRIGESHPASYGYIRRYIYIKQNTNATINMNITYPYSPTNLPYDAYTEDQVDQEFRVRFKGNTVYNRSMATPYKMDLLREPFTIRITNLSSVLNNSATNPSPVAQNGSATYATLSTIGFYDCAKGDFIGSLYPQSMYLSVDDNATWAPQTIGPAFMNPVTVKDSIQLTVKTLWPPPSSSLPGNWTVIFDGSDRSCLDMAFIFQDGPPRTLVTGSFLYDYNNVTRPGLVPGVLEVSIW